jgi:tRNA A22 N-methylase
MQDKFKFGPYLLNHYHPAFEKKWRAEVIKLIMICDEISRSSSTAAKEKLFHIEKEIRQIEEVLVCFAKDKPL